ncbi:MAG: DNA translocase FtsK [Paludibacteraceae bacterium]|nr:DNA translocase FtsK [Paludibacteraceae bacterium]
MPKRPTKRQDYTPGATRSSRGFDEGPSVWTQLVEFLKSDNFRIISGLVLLALTLYLLLAYVSYFFTGAYDQSALEDPEAKLQIRNWGGATGARLSDFFVNQAFGISFVSVLVMTTLYGLGLLHAITVKWWKVLFSTLFFLIWGSITCGYLDNELPIDTFFRLGGRHGEIVAGWLCENINWIGTLILIVVTLLIYFLVASEKTLPLLKRCWRWFMGLFRKKEAVEPDDLIVVGEDGQSTQFIVNNPDADETVSQPIDLTPDLPDEPEEPTAPEDIFTINQTDNEEGDELPADGDEDEDDLSADEVEDESEDAENADPDLDINKPTENEMLENDPEYILKTQGPYDPRAELAHYQFPSLNLLKTYDNENAPVIDQDEQKANAAKIVTTLHNYGVEIASITATVGPTVTLYEVVPQAGVRIAKIQNLENDIMMSLSAVGIRIIAPMPGKGTVGIEVPNVNPQIVSMHSVIASKKFQENTKMRLPVALGRTITNDIFMFDLAKTPHLLVAGATGQGKSVAINAIITSLLYKKHPAEMKMVLVDPKMVEFAPYKPLLKHYLAAIPGAEDNEVIITDCDKVVNTLNSLVIEMENRYKLLMDAGVRNLEDYNDKFIARRLNPVKVVAEDLHHRYLPYIVIIIDEYGDFIMQAGKQVETPIARITQKARAVGMHMILATQRPSVNIVTGVIKANIPTRIALRTQSVVDSRTVLDAKGADQLIGRGDLLYSGAGDLTRVQCAFVDTPEVDAIVDHIKNQQAYFEPYELPEYVGENGDGGGEGLAPGAVDLRKLDPMFRDIATYVVNSGQGSTSIIQRKFQIGYNRAGKISDQLEAAGIVGPNKGPKGRDVLIQDDMTLQLKFKELGI